MLNLLALVAIFLMPTAIFCIFIPIWIRHSRTQFKIVRKQYNQAIELNPLYQQKVIAERSHQLAVMKLEHEQRRFDHQVKTDLAKLWIETHYVQAERYIVNADIESITALPSLKAASQVKVNTVDNQDFPSSCRFSEVLRDFTPSMHQIFLGYLPEYKMVTSAATDLCHVANVGATGGGKSNNIRLIVPQLCYVGAHVVLLNPHYTSYDRLAQEDWTPIESKLYRPPVRDFNEIRKWLRWSAEKELRRRLDCYARSQPFGAPLFLVVEELPAISKHVPEAMNWIADILREGRKVHLFVITAAQDMLVKTLGIGGSGAIRDCFRTAIYVGGDATTARKLLDVQGEVDDSGLGKGIVMLRSSQCKQATLARVPYADNESLYSLLGPSTFDFSQTVDADPPVDLSAMDETPSNVLPIREKTKVTLEDAIQAWNEGYNTVRTMADHLGITRYQAEVFCRQIRDMSESSGV